MREHWQRWVAFCSEKESPLAIALVRISIGCTLFFTCASPYFAGVWSAIWVDQSHGGIRNYRNIPWFLELLGGATPEAVESLLWIGMGSAMCLIIGLFGRLAALLGMIVMNTIAWHNTMATGGHDDLIANILWLLVFVPNDITLSLRSKLQTGSWLSETPILSIIRRLLLVQLLIMYGSTGLQKVSVHWVPFGQLDALWYILQQPTWGWRNHAFLAPYFFWTQLGTLGTWLFELGAPLLGILMFWEHGTTRWYRPTWGQRIVAIIRPRILFAVIGIPMHIGILLTIDVGPFSYAALSVYWTLWYRPLTISTTESVEKFPDETS